MMKERQVFLAGMGAIYLVAFGSYYVQYPGLLGKDGLEPVVPFLANVRNQIDRQGGKSPLQLWQRFPVLSWFTQELNTGISAPTGQKWHVDDLHDGLCLLGMMLGLIVFSGWCQHGLLFAVLWLSYLTLQKVGQTFLGFQWDILLLEVGFVTTLYAPWLGRGGTKAPMAWVLRWVFFKLMLMAGAVKLQSGCPTWFQLTALEYHYATQCLPSPLAYWAHQLHPLLQRFSVASTLVIELPATLLLVSPILAHRRVGATLQILLQILIILTGNYNYFNALAMLLCIPVWASDYDEEDAPQTSHVGKGDVRQEVQALKRKGPFMYLSNLLQVLEGTRWWAWGHCLAAWVAVYISATYLLTIKSTYPPLPYYEHVSIDLKLGLGDLDGWLSRCLWPTILTVGCLLCFSGLVYVSRQSRRSVSSALRAVTVSILALSMFFITTVPLTQLHTATRRKLPHVVLELFQRLQPYSISSGYGLFRTMTGVGRYDPQSRGWGDRPASIVVRPEIILEGFDGQEWKEIHFRYKPGCTTCRPRFVAPHQPRLDWQMWFAALGSYQSAPWLVHLVDKLLEGSQPVMRLLDMTLLPGVKSGEPPFSEIRARRYDYDFTRIHTPWSARLATARLLPSTNSSGLLTGVSEYWHRSDTYNDYLPGSIGRNNPSVKAFLSQYGWDAGADSAIEGSMESVKSIEVRVIMSVSLLEMIRWIRAREQSIDLIEYQYPILLSLLVTRLPLRVYSKLCVK